MYNWYVYYGGCSYYFITVIIGIVEEEATTASAPCTLRARYTNHNSDYLNDYNYAFSLTAPATISSRCKL